MVVKNVSGSTTSRLNRISKRMPLVLLILLVVGVIVAYFSAIHTYNASIKKQVHERLEIVEAAINEKMSTEFLSHARRLAGFKEIKKYLEGDINDEEHIYLILDSIKQIDNASFTAVVNADGIINSTSSHPKKDKLIGLDISFRRYIQEALNGKEAIYPTVGKVTEIRSTVFAAPVFSKENEVIGVVMLSFYMDQLDRILKKYVEPIALISPEGVIYASNNEEWILKTKDKKTESERVAILEKTQFGMKLLNDVHRDFKEKQHTLFSNAMIINEVPVSSLQGWKLVSTTIRKFPVDIFAGYILAYWCVVLLVWGMVFFWITSREALRIKYESEAENKRAALIMENAKQIEAREEKLRIALHCGRIGLWSCDLNTNAVEASENVFEILQIDPSMFTGDMDSFLALIFPEDIEVIREGMNKTIQTGADYDVKYRVKSTTSPDGLWISATGNCVNDENGNPEKMHGALVSIDELTRAYSEKEQLQEKLKQTERLDSIGQLAGGVAHDFNNMLGGILGAAELLMGYLEENSKAQELTEMIVDTAERAADLTAKLLAFSRKQTYSTVCLDINHTIDESVSLLERTIDRNIRISKNLEAKDHFVVGDFSGLQNAFINLGINASHAMPEGGVLSITTSIVELDKIYCEKSQFNITQGKYIEIEFRDTGEGIPPKDLPHIFEPFFTSKEQGKGTGLGLAAVYGTMMQHGGSISVYSELKIGTSFKMMLPLSDECGVKLSSIHGISEPILGSGCILLIDDEEVMRNTGKAILEDLGYQVITAIDGKEGLKLFTEHKDTIDLVLLDMIMPEMSGRECFDEVREISPNMNVVITSGFVNNSDINKMKHEGLSGHITKPYRSVDLSILLNDIMTK